MLRGRTWLGALVVASAGAACWALAGAAAASAAAPLAWAVAGRLHAEGVVSGVSCPAPGFCVAVSGERGILVSRDPLAGSWTVLHGVDRARGGLAAVGCPSERLCFGVDDLGDLLYGAPLARAAGWAVEPGVDLLRGFTAIACPSSALCVAGDRSGDLIVSSAPRNPFAWSLPIPIDPGHRITALSCPSRSLCVAVDGAGDLFSSTHPTAPLSWTETRLTSSAALEDVSCTRAALCVAVGSDGDVFAARDLTATPPTWSTTPVDGTGALTSVSCTSAGLCLAVDRDGTAYETDTPTSGAPNWQLVRVSTDPTTVTSVSCVSAGFCVYGDAAALMTGTLPAPSATTDAAAATSQTTAVLYGAVDANDAALTRCVFEYGPTSAYGRSVPCSPPPRPTGGAQPLVAHVRGLRPATTYHFRIVAASALGTSAGGDGLLATPALLRASPSLAGATAVGSTLTCQPNVAIPPTDTVTYAWLRDERAIPGAFAATYVLTAADGTHHIRCSITISGDGGSTTAATGYVSIPSQVGRPLAETTVGPARIMAGRVSVPVTCSPDAAARCTISLTLTARSSATPHAAVGVGDASYPIAAGGTRRLGVALDTRGRRLLRRRRRMRVTLTVSGTVLGELVARLGRTTLVLSTGAGAQLPSGAG